MEREKYECNDDDGLDDAVAALQSLCFTAKRNDFTTAQLPSPQEIVDGVYLGDISDAFDYCELERLGITHVLSCIRDRIGDEYTTQMYNTRGIAHTSFAMEDEPDYDMRPFFVETAALIDSVVHSHGRILVHCSAGMSRSPTIVMVYLMFCQHISAYEAVKTVVSKRRQVFPNHGFLRQLVEFDVWIREAYMQRPCLTKLS